MHIKRSGRFDHVKAALDFYNQQKKTDEKYADEE